VAMGSACLGEKKAECEGRRCGFECGAWRYVCVTFVTAVGSAALVSCSPSLPASNPTYPAERIHFCVLRNYLVKGVGGKSPKNHWVLCLETTDSRSVMLYMAQSDGTDRRRGKIKMSTLVHEWLHPYPYPHHTLHAFTSEPIRPMHVKNVINLINTRGRDAYNFPPELEDCRFWMLTVMKDLEDEKWLPPGEWGLR